MNDDIQAYDAWRTATGFAKDKALADLLEQLRGPIGTAINAYRGAPLPPMVLELEARSMATEACRTWDKSRGVSLASYVGTQVRQGLFRYVSTYQNVARIPENQIRQIGSFKASEEHLTDKFGRTPSAAELADHMGITLRQVTALQTSLRKDHLDSIEGGLESESHDPNFERAMLGYYSLTPTEQAAFDYLTGSHGRPKLKPGEIAAKLNVSGARVSALKESIGKKLKVFLDG
jgi:DNA-binding CsgD family transcriptional regulator